MLHLTVENVKPLSSKAPNLPVSTATVIVTVVNENEAPHFREDPIQIVAPESVVPGTVLKGDIAFDPDDSELRYGWSHKKMSHCSPICRCYGGLDCFSDLLLDMRSAETLGSGWTSTQTQERSESRETST